MAKLLIVRVRGNAMIKPSDKSTLAILKISKMHACSVVKDTPSTRAMLKRLHHLVTWGEADEELATTLAKKGKKTSSGTVYTTLAPPKGGFASRGIKKPFSKGGALGYRGDKIALLVKKML